MGKFDKQIGWCRERYATAEQDLQDFDSGFQVHLNQINVTSELVRRAKDNVHLYNRMIVAYERRNA